MKFKPVRLAPVLIAGCVIALVCLLRLLDPDPVERAELMTYDMRVREAMKFAPPAATNLGFVLISDNTIAQISKGLLGNSYGLYWPRQIYGRVLRELANEKARAVGYDVIFGERRPDHAPVPVSLTTWPEAAAFYSSVHPVAPPVTYEDHGEKFLLMESDDYFAWQLRRAGNAILAADRGVQPDPLFATNAFAVADIAANRDADGVLRRVKAFEIYTNWHWLFRAVESDPSYAVDLRKARVEHRRIVLPRPEGLDPIRVPIDSENNFDVNDLAGRSPSPGPPKMEKAFTTERIWNMGIVLAACALNLDLAHADVELERGRITLTSRNGPSLALPVDRDGYFYINWEMPYNDPRVTKEPMEDLIERDMARSSPGGTIPSGPWRDKLAIIGSTTVGNDLTDRGATPLEQDTMLVSGHWNVANSILRGRFVDRSSTGVDLLLIAAMGIVAALLTWRLRALVASAAVALLMCSYTALAGVAYVENRYWMPLILPIGGGLLLTHVCLVTWRVVFEQAERRRIKSIFSTVVSPKIMDELLKAENLSLGGARREVTVMFADVRGFTEFTDTTQERAAAYVAENKLIGAAAEGHFDEQAREALNTVNLYLGLVADTIIRHDATLDKFIGDCVMAFWGAPTANPRHALACVRAAIESQRAIHQLNCRRAVENRQRELENLARKSAGLAPKPLLPILLLGSGINTGMATAGLMGSAAETRNYTVFGREVNLASRLETISGRGRIIISEATCERLQREDPELAGRCTPLPDVMVKGIRLAVKTYEVPWRPAGSAPFEEELTRLAAAEADPAPVISPGAAR